MANVKITTNSSRDIVTISSQGPKGDRDQTPFLRTIHISGSEYSGSVVSGSHILTSIAATGSILPEGSGNWDLGSPTNPFRDLYITTESLKFVSKTSGQIVSSLSAQNVEDLKVGKTITTTTKTLTKRDGTTETKSKFIEGSAFISSIDNDVYIKTTTDRMDLIAGGSGGSEISLKNGEIDFGVGGLEALNILKDTEFASTITLGGPNCTSRLIIKSRTEINCSVTCSGLLSTDPIYAPAFIETGTGTPTITSDSNLVLSASNAVVIASSPLRLRSFTNTETASGQFTFIAGDMYFNSTTNKFMGHNGSSHVALS